MWLNCNCSSRSFTNLSALPISAASSSAVANFDFDFCSASAWIAMMLARTTFLVVWFILDGGSYLGDLYTESGQTLQGSFSAVSKPNFASKYALESSRRDLHNALLCTVLNAQNFLQKSLKFLPIFSLNVAKIKIKIKCPGIEKRFSKTALRGRM